MPTFSIDQNSHPLWDALPKLHALAHHGRDVRHCVEDVDVAFAAVGAARGSALRLERERYHVDGGADWGAALFYSEFLGRLPVDPRRFEPCTGLKTRTLADHTGRTLRALYDEFSPGDNWQLIGPSYVDSGDRHRVVGDLRVSETEPFLREMMDKARDDMFAAFPGSEAQQRLKAWFAREDRRLDDLLAEHAGGRLVELYRDWLRAWLPASVPVGLSSDIFALDAGRDALFELFLDDYENVAAMYNESLAETDVGLRPLAVKDGELPFFAVYRHEDHWVRSPVLRQGDALAVAGRTFPLADGGARLPRAALRDGGIVALAGKAVLLVIQVRLGPGGGPLALPYRGSVYTPAANAFTARLAEAGRLPEGLHPIVRVRFHLLDRMRELDTPVRLPAHLRSCFGRDELPARAIGENWADLAAEAARRLERLRDEQGRREWQRERFADLAAGIDERNRRRRQLAESGAPRDDMKALWDEERELERRLLEGTLQQTALDVQVSDIDYWDSRGALLPWAAALGGEGFYDRLVAAAEIYAEPAPEGIRHAPRPAHSPAL